MEKGFLVMSAQNAKKKRLGSRRVAASQSDTSKSDRYNVTESYSLTQHHELEETAESLNDLSNPGDSKPETQHPPSPETALNKRKLGSSRRSKGRQFVNDSETKLYLNPGKEVEEKGRSNKTLETISLPQAVQLERQEDFGQGSDYVFALPKSDSSNTSDDYSEAKKPTIMDSPEGLMEIFIPKTDDLKTDNACENETKLKEINKSDTKSEEIKDIAHVVTQLSNSRDMPDEEPSNVLSVAERGSTKRDETDLFRQDRRLQGNSLANESHVVLESITLDITTDKNSHEQNTEVVYAAEQETFSLSKKELSKNEEQKPFSSSEDGEAWQSDNSTSKVHEEDVKPKEIYYMHQNVTKNEGSHVHEFKKLTDNRETVDDATEISNTYQAQLMVQSADDSVSNDDKQNEHYTNKRDCLMQENEEGDVYKRNISLQTLLTEINFPFESQLEDNTVSVDKQPDTGFDPSGIRRKLGSSRKNKGKRHVKEGSENITGDETLEPSATETARPEVLGQRTEHHVSLSVPHDSSMISDSTPAYSPKAPNFAATTFTEINLDILIPESENLEDQNQSNFKGVSPKPVESGLEEVDKSNNPLGEKVRGNHHLEDMMKAQETKPTKIQEMQVKDYSSETIMDNATEISSAMSRDLGQKSEGELSQENDLNIVVPLLHENLECSISTPTPSEVQNLRTTNYTEIAVDSLIPKRENVPLNQDEIDFRLVSENPIDTGLEGVDKSKISLSEELRKAHHSKDLNKVQEATVNPVQIHEIQPNDYSSVTDEAMQVTSTVPENLGQSEIRDTLQAQLMVQSPDDSAAKLELSTADDKQGAHHFLTQVIEEGGTSEGKDIGVSLQTPLTEINTSFESQLEENTVSIDEQPDTAFGSSGIRRKLGSSRRNKGRQHVKEFKVENATRDENPDTIQTPETETTRPEEFFQEREHDVPQSVPHDSSTFTVSTPAYSTEVQNQATTSYSEINLDSLIPESENLQERQDERDFKVVFDESVEAGLEGVDNSDTAVSEEVKNAHHSEDAEKKGQEEEVKVTQTQEIQPNDYSSVTDEAMQVTSTVPENLGQSEIRDTLQAQLMVQSPDDSAAKLELSTADDKQGAHHFLTQVIEEGGTSEGKDIGVSLQTPLTEINTSFESQLEENTVSIDEQPDTAFGSSGIRRKLGSSRRNKGRQHVKEFKVENATHDENPEAIKTSARETRPEELLRENEYIKSDKVDSDHNLKDTVKKLPEEKAKPSQIQEMQSSNRKNLEFVDGRIEGNFLEEPRISDVDKEKTVLGPVSEDRVKDDLNPKTEQPHNQEELSEMEQNKSSFLISETNVFSEPRENSLSIDEKSNTGFQHSGHRRKLGSSRRNKGKHCTKDSTTESYHKPTEYNETAKTEEEEDVQNSTLVHTPDLTIVGVHTDPTVDQQGFDQSHLIQIPDKQLSNEYSITDTESKGKDECTKLSRQDGNLHNYLVSPIRMEIYTKKDSTEVHKKPEKRVGKEMKGSDRTENRERDDNIELLTEDRNLQGINLLSETHVKSENTEYMITTEIKTEKITHPEGSKVECTVVQQTFLPLKNEVPTNTEQDEHCTPADVTGAHQSEGDIDKVHEEQQVAQMQATHQTDNTSVTESKYSLQTLSSDTNISLDFQPQDSSQSIREVNTALSRAGNRKKLGSSRRNKGRQCVKDSVLEADQELKGEVAESSTRDETLNTDEISPATATTWEEEDSESLNLLTGCDTVKKDLMQSPQASVLKDDSDIEDISYHDGIVSSRSVEVLDKEKTFQVENTSALSFDKDLRQEVQDMASNELPSIAEEPAVDTSNGSGISVTMDTSNNQQEETHSENKGNLPMNSKQKRRKMGSTRRIQLNRKHEEETENKGETKESDFNVEGDVVEELPLTVEAQQNENAQPSLSAICKEQETDEATSLQSSAESNMIPGIEDLMAALPEQSASLSEEILSLFVKVDDVREAIVEPLQQDDFTNSETPITAVVGGRSKRSINQLLPPDSEVTADTGITEGNLVSFSEARESTLSDEETPESIKVIRDQDSHEKKPNKSNEEAHDKNPEMKNVSPNSNSANRRRKMGSTRRNLGSRAKEDLHQKQEVDNEAEVSKTNTGAIMTESVPGTKQNEFQPHPEHKDSGNEQGKEKVLETVEISHAVESQSKPLAEQTVEENTILQGQLVETEHGQTTNYPPSTSPKKDVVSESASGGRRRKLGSNRKSRGHQHAEHQTEEGRRTDHQNERDVRSITEEGTVKTTEVHREESLGLDKISEVEQSDKKPSSGISKTGEHTRAVRDKTSVQPCNAEIVLTPQSQTQLSLVGNPRGTDPTSKRYNVVMIGDSSVGKTSFMKRAQSGKFSLDIPASIGLDSLMWPVVVDGKPVVLQLWDTAGQERFHSITKQVFHKAQAFLLMYDITSTQSFSAVSYWANCIQESATENVIVLLLGNKSDCAQRRIKTHQGEVLAKEYDFEFMECSAATGENVIQSLEIVARKLSQRIDTREEATVLYKEPEQKKASRCC